MSPRLNEFLELSKSLATKLRTLSPSNVVLLHHNDTDGVSSGAILSKALERADLSVSRYCLEKPWPQVLVRLFEDTLLEADTCFIFADFGSGMLPEISKINRRRFQIFVLDHHNINKVDDDSINLLNPMGFGFDGSTEASASAVSWTLANFLGIYNQDLSSIGVLGALGDRQTNSEGKLIGLNDYVAQVAVSREIIKKNDDYWILSGTWMRTSLLREELDALGSLGYLKGGTDIALKGLLEGFDERYQYSAQAYIDEFEAEYQRFISTSPIRSEPSLDWFNTDGFFLNAGVKTVGLICERMIETKVITGKNYLAGFQSIPNEVPGLGKIDIGQTKVSMRIAPPLLSDVRAKKLLNLNEILPAATREVGGFVDACHLHAAATSVPMGQELALIKELVKKIAGR